jgi:uncharacterized protein with PIN domain
MKLAIPAPVPPDKEVLEAYIEAHSKCPQCGGGIRAVAEGCDKTSSALAELDILVTVCCRDAKCGWTAEQWRPWKATNPNVL